MSIIEKVNIRYKLPPEYLSSAAVIYYEAFTEKMSYLVKDMPNGILMAKEILLTKQILFAELSSECVGIASIRFGEYSKRKSVLGIFIKYAGIFRGVSAYITSILLDRKVRVNEMRIDNLAVKPNHRGKGIGRALLGRAYQIAKEYNLQKVILEVVDTNISARHLYELEGYSAIKIYEYPIIGRLMGYSKSILMEKKVT
jgi:ribosomal protein S18 acetylase RimI-like enzyme